MSTSWKSSKDNSKQHTRLIKTIILQLSISNKQTKNSDSSEEALFLRCAIPQLSTQLLQGWGYGPGEHSSHRGSASKLLPVPPQLNATTLPGLLGSTHKSDSPLPWGLGKQGWQQPSVLKIKVFVRWRGWVLNKRKTKNNWKQFCRE